MMGREVDVAALYGALDSRREARQMSWREIAREMGLSASIFTRMAQGRRPDLESYIQMTTWLGVSTETFIGGRTPVESEPAETVEVISAHLRADHSLKPESARAIEKIVRAAYGEMAER
jgi:transcriptional regulator with XRE-family HTH domain